MVIDPTNSNVVYAGTGEGWLNEDAVYGGGIYKTTDFAIQWMLLSSTTGASVSNFRDVMKIAADPSEIFMRRRKTIRTNTAWGISRHPAVCLCQTTAEHRGIRSAQRNDSTNYFTPDDVIPVSSTVIVFAVESSGSTLGGIYRTTDGGTTWSKIASNLPTSNYRRIALAQDPNNSNTLFAVFESLDLTIAGTEG